MTTKQYTVTMKTWILSLFILSSFAAQSQDTAEVIADSTEGRIYSENSIGYRIGIGHQVSTLISDIKELNNLNVQMCGGNLGVTLRSKRTFVTSTIGVYYSAASMPYSIDILEGNLLGGVYLLPHRNKKTTWLEPYTFVNIKGVVSTFFGNYLENDKSYGSFEKKTGSINAVQGSVGLGAEYQLGNSFGDFLHFFAEVQYGTTLLDTPSRVEFSTTHVNMPISAMIGVCFGRFK